MKNCFLFLLTLMLLTVPSPLHAQGSAFTYQGQLQNSGGPANGNYDFTFALFNTNSTNTGQVGGAMTNLDVGVTNGLFAVTLDFGSVFTSNATWLAIGVRTNGGANFTALNPLQKLTPTPYADYAATAATATTAASANAVTASNIVGTIPAVNLPADVALTGANQTFTGNNSFSGNISMLNPSSTIVFPATSGVNSPMMTMFSSGTLNADRMVIAHSPVYQNWGLQYQDSSDKFNFLSAGVPVLSVNLENQSIYTIGNVGIGTTNPASALEVNGTITIDGNASVAFNLLAQGNVAATGNVGARGNTIIDSAGLNTGAPVTNALTFGGLTGEGIGSIRTNGYPDSFGLDFYTDYIKQMTILNNGNVGIGTANPASLLTLMQSNVGGRGAELSLVNPATSTTGNEVAINFATDPSTYNADNPNAQIKSRCVNGASGANDMIFSTYNGSSFAERMRIQNGGRVGIGTASPQQALDVNGEFMVVDGLGGEQAYLGGDGLSGNGGLDVQIGSLNTNVSVVSCYNAGSGSYMHLNVSSISVLGGADLAEPFNMSQDQIPPGSVVVIDRQNPGKLKLSTQPYDKCVAGIVSGANGIKAGVSMQQTGFNDKGQNVALNGKVYVLADAAHAPIEPGDLLTTSATPGHAMKADDSTKVQGAILGKAMSSLAAGKGMVLVLVTLQ